MKTALAAEGTVGGPGLAFEAWGHAEGPQSQFLRGPKPSGRRALKLFANSLVPCMNHPLDCGALFIHRAGIPALVNHPVLVVVGKKEQVLLAGFHLEAIVAVLAEDGDFARLLAFDLPVDMDNIGGAIQAVP